MIVDVGAGLSFSGDAEELAPLEPVVGCQPIEHPGVVAFRSWILRRAGGYDLGIVRDCGIGRASKHHEGRAWDWGCTQSLGDTVWTQLRANGDELARRAGLRTMIWALGGKPTIWIAGRTDPYRGANPHRDHIHFGFGWAGALGHTSLYPAFSTHAQRDHELERACAPIPDPTTLPALPGLAKTTPAFRRALVRTAESVSVDPDHLAAVICFETAGQWRGDARNPHSGAVGLIQWLRSSARHVHDLSLEQLAAMSALEQLPLVAEWMRRANLPQKPSLADVYLAVFAPAFIGAPPTAPVYTDPAKAYRWNRTLDRDGNGVITVEEVARPVTALLAAAKTKPRVEVAP